MIYITISVLLILGVNSAVFIFVSHKYPKKMSEAELDAFYDEEVDTRKVTSGSNLEE